jgi:flagellar motor switch protein FliM
MDPLKGSSVLEMDPAITFTIIDRLFGGKGVAAKISRELTDIELSVMEGIVVRMLGCLRESWANVIDLRPRLGNIETNPNFAAVVPPSDMVVLITLETRVGEVEGMTNFCIPYITIEPIINKLSAQYWYSSIRKGATNENLVILKDRLNAVDVELTAELGRVEVTMADVLALSLGDVVKLVETKVTDDLVLRVGNRDKYRCRPGTVGTRVAVQITDVLEKFGDEEALEELGEEQHE